MIGRDGDVTDRRAETTNYEVVNREMGRARVTMEWEVDCEFETTEGGGIQCVGWIADAVATVARCDRDNPQTLKIERIDGKSNQ